MEGGVADRDASHDHRPELGHGCQHPGPPHVADDLIDDRLLLLGGVLVRDRPAGRAGDEAELQLLVVAVHLDHQPVDLVVEVVAVVVPVRVVLDHLVDRPELLPPRVDPEAHGIQGLQHLPLAAGRAPRVEGVHEGLEVPAGRDPRVQLAHAPCRSVAYAGIRIVQSLDQGGHHFRRALAHLSQALCRSVAHVGIGIVQGLDQGR